MADNPITPSQDSQANPIAPSPASKNNKFMMGALGVVILAAMIAIFIWGRGTEKQAQAASATFACATPDCGFTELRVLQVDETFPMPCPKCGNKTLYCSRKCPNCGTAVIMDEDRGQPGPTKCPKCGNEVRHGQ